MIKNVLEIIVLGNLNSILQKYILHVHSEVMMIHAKDVWKVVNSSHCD